MTTIFFFVAAALVLVFFEVIIPGGILGILAFLCVLAASYVGYQEYGLFIGFLIFVVSGILCLVLCFVELKFLSKSKFGRGLFLKESVSGYSNRQTSSDLIGMTGTTVTRLNPSGKVEIEGKHFEAYSEDGYLDPGASVVVRAKDDFKLIINKL